MADRSSADERDTEVSPVSVARAERIKLTAAYLNTVAGGLSTAGVVAPLAAAVFGIAGPTGSLPVLTLVIGVTMFSIASIVLHIAGRIALKGLDR